MAIDLPGHPDIIIPDLGPLLLLSSMDALALLHQVGCAVVMPDLVRRELESDPESPQSAPLLSWIDEGLAPGSAAPISVEVTGIGEALRLARVVKPDFRMRGGGEVAMMQWLAAEVSGTEKSALVLYENGKVPKLIADQNIQANIDVVTTRAFLVVAEQRGLIPSAEALWHRIVEASPTTTMRSAPSRSAGRPAAAEMGLPCRWFQPEERVMVELERDLTGQRFESCSVAELKSFQLRNGR